jgi:predicted SprT family Zn-dependent metalloprotease
MPKEEILLRDGSTLTYDQATFCQTGSKTGEFHDLIYQGRDINNYRCRSCGVTLTKADLRDLTN